MALQKVIAKIKPEHRGEINFKSLAQILTFESGMACFVDETMGTISAEIKSGDDTVINRFLFCLRRKKGFKDYFTIETVES